MTSVQKQSVYAIYEKISRLRNDYTSGCTIIAKKALKVFGEAVEMFPKKGDFHKIIMFAEGLKSAKPSMGALRIIISEAMSELEKMEPPYDFSAAAVNIARKMNLATEKCIENAVGKIFANGPETHIVTCSYSSTVIKTLRKAKQEGKTPIVWAIESKWANRRYGEAVRNQCDLLNIQSTLIKDSQIDKLNGYVDCALIGADSLLLNGRAINGTPSFKLARLFKSKAPFYLVAESFKNSSDIHIEEGYDYLPADLITEIFTDEVFKKHTYV